MGVERNIKHTINTLWRKDDNMITIEIYWQDLVPRKQEEIIEKLGDNGNWDAIPIVKLEIEED